jgi:hypothetical protein
MLRTPPTSASPAARPFERRRREEPGTRRGALVVGVDREGLHLVAQRVRRPAVGQEHLQPEARARPAVEGERLAAMRLVDDR